jgi:hypothetical protein
VSQLRVATTCRNSRTARNDSDQLGLDRVVIHVSQPLLVSLSWFNPGVRYNHWVQPRGVRYNHGVKTRVATTRVVIRGGPAPCAELACCVRPPPRVGNRGSNPSSSHCRGANPGFGTLLESLSWFKPTRTRCSPVGGRVQTVGFNPVVVTTRVATALSPQQEVLSSVACAWFGLRPKGCQSRVRSQCRQQH